MTIDLLVIDLMRIHFVKGSPSYPAANKNEPETIEMRENDAYERPQQATMKISIEDNPAYGVSTQALTTRCIN